MAHKRKPPREIYGKDIFDAANVGNRQAKPTKIITCGNPDCRSPFVRQKHIDDKGLCKDCRHAEK